MASSALFVLICAILALCGAVRSQPYVPGQQAPYFEFEDVNGVIVQYGKFEGEAPGSSKQLRGPVVVFMPLTTDPDDISMLAKSSIDRFLQLDVNTIAPTQFVFIVQGLDTIASRVAYWMEERVHERIENMGYNATWVDMWKNRLIFARTGLDSTETLSNLVELLTFEGWNSPHRTLKVSIAGGNPGREITMSRLDGHFGWIPRMPQKPANVPSARYPVYGHMKISRCEKEASVLEGSHHSPPLPPPQTPYVLLATKNATMTFAELLEVIQMANEEEGGNIVYVMFYSCDQNPPGSSLLEEITCEGMQCDLQITIPATTIKKEDGLTITSAINKGRVPTVAVQDAERRGSIVLIDGMDKLQQNGYRMWPWLASLGWSAQYMVYQMQVETSKKESRAQIEASHSKNGQDPPHAASRVNHDGNTTIYVEDILGGPLKTGEITVTHTFSSEVTETLESEETDVFIELELGCSGPVNSGNFDVLCPEWDHVLQLHACCGPRMDTCMACPPLIWNAGPGGRDPEGGILEAGSSVGNGTDVCGSEVARWITPFRRNNGRWRTNISALKAVLLRGKGSEFGQICQFKFRSVPWAKTGDLFWNPHVYLVIERSGEPQVLVNHKIINLFGDRTFDAAFNDRPPVYFSTPINLRRARIFAVVSGHGSDENGCAEFCPGITLQFIVNGNTHDITFDLAGTQLGCTEAVTNGSSKSRSLPSPPSIPPFPSLPYRSLFVRLGCVANPRLPLQYRMSTARGSTAGMGGAMAWTSSPGSLTSQQSSWGRQA